MMMKHRIFAMLALVLLSAGTAAAVQLGDRPDPGRTGHQTLDKTEQVGHETLSAAGAAGHWAVDEANGTATMAQKEADEKASAAQEEAQEARDRAQRLAQDVADRAGEEVDWIGEKLDEVRPPLSPPCGSVSIQSNAPGCTQVLA